MIAIIAFAATILGLFFCFDIIPGVGPFAGSIMTLIGGTVLLSSWVIRDAQSL